MSDNYRALTRTYRPTSFDDIVSQKHVSNTLKNAIKQNRLAHAYMFCGPRGVGKTTMARVLARTVNEIDQQIDGESLNQTLNVVEIDAASNNKVDDIRDLRERVRIPPQNGRYKVYIIDEVHMLSKSAFNALLKTLEEPPDHIIFIFATTEPHKVLPTILSRVQRFDFKRISIDEIVDRLRSVAKNEGIQIDDESLHVIAKKADGALRDALGLLDQAISFCGNDIQHEELLRALNVVSTERMFDFMNTVEQQDASKGLELINDLLQEGYDIQEYLVGLAEHIRNLYVAKSSAKMHLVEASPDTKKRYKQAAKSFSEDDLIRMLHMVSEAQYKIKEAQQPKIQFEITLLKLIHMERRKNLDTLVSELQQLKKKLSNQPAVTTDTDADTQTASSDLQQDSSTEKKEIKPDSNVSGSERPPQPPEPVIREETENRSEETNNADSPEAEIESETETVIATEIAGEETEATPNDDDFDQLFGRSSLNKEVSNASNGSGTPAREEQKTESSPKRAPKDISFDEVLDCWDPFIDDLRKEVPQMLYFQMQRLKPAKLENGDLLLHCNDDFAKQVVEENSRQLGQILGKQLNAFLNIKCKVKKRETTEEESMSPYERFKKLQERDPTIKTLVELFGAELDYNLNQ
ncbi:DNA polymerase III subunit gamma/tau [Aliifodinibius salicampi]|uniref:DNA polymerase III subunit gamma/tau n=1 Tax=Fodinibius salicampi TaxID=1920655 RepID=A0ABT3Q0R1_9BACT|nr:DNA polymerase III subunit gamma/tau [Fodinibius salicampi]MCW9713708.1 DNA polymerase III subunit gamma/tau [Fodinibius salicampi]